MTRLAKKQTLRIRELAPDEMPGIYPLTKQMNPGLTRRQFTAGLKAMSPLGYRCLGAFDGNRLVGACGFWTGVRIWCGHYIEIDNLVVDQSQRSRGVGKLLVDFVEREAKRLKCAIIMADSYTHNTGSHRFYCREGYIIKGFCFVKEL